MEEWAKQESSITLTKGEWCDVIIDLKRAVEYQKKRLADYESTGKFLEERGFAIPGYDDSVKSWRESIEASDRTIKKIEASI